MTAGAFNVNTAYFHLIQNNFSRIRRHAFQIHNWNNILVEGNRFANLEAGFFSAPYTNQTDLRTDFTFANNTLTGIEVDVLDFIPLEPELEVLILNNTFEDVCHCHLETWIRERAGDSWESFYETSFCVVSELLEKCYNLTRGYMNMKEYMENYCTPDNLIVCDDVEKTYHPNIFVQFDLHNTERTVLGVIFLGVICSIAIMVTILGLIWMKDRGLCGYKRKTSSSNFFLMCSKLCNNGNLVTTDSISRINIHEYAEIQNQLNQQQKHIVLAVEEDPSDEELVVYENKATQTIPEELTQELIQSLREKLDNPDNYSEARDMIEHLYDLIKIEERCNNNNDSPTASFIFDDEEDVNGIYEVIKSSNSTSLRATRPKRKKVDVVSTGTRAPSPDKLLPVSFAVIKPVPTIVSDYVEPRDRKSNEYCELPSAGVIMPDVLPASQIKDKKELTEKAHIYAVPLPSIARRPLPAQPGTSHS